MFKNLELTINFRNPVEFINQWSFEVFKIKHIFIWLLYGWIYNTCDCWMDYGIRIIGIEINIRRYLIRTSRG